MSGAERIFWAGGPFILGLFVVLYGGFFGLLMAIPCWVLAYENWRNPV